MSLARDWRRGSASIGDPRTRSVLSRIRDLRERMGLPWDPNYNQYDYNAADALLDRTKRNFQRWRTHDKKKRLRESEQEKKHRLKARSKKREASAAATWQSEFDTAKAEAYENARKYFTDKGLNPDSYADIINETIERIAGGYETGQDFQGAFQDIGESIYDTETNKLRESAVGNVNEYFTPNLGYNLIADTADDSALSEILASQYDDALESLKRASARNQITGTGYKGGEAELTKQREQGSSFLNTLGSDLLASGRENISNIGSEATQAANQLNLGQTWDLSPYSSRVQSSVDSFLNSLKGNLAGQAGDLFDKGGALSQAHIVQGQQNLGQTVKPKSGAFFGGDEEDEGENRLAPTQNVF